MKHIIAVVALLLAPAAAWAQSQPFCMNDAPVSGPHRSLCLQATASGGLISYNALNGATPLPVLCNVNGATVSNCLAGGGGGGGNMTGPGASTPNEIASFVDTTGTSLRQGPARITDAKTAAFTADNYAFGAFSQSGLTANRIWKNMFGSDAVGIYDAVRGVSIATANSTLLNVQAIGAYILNNNTPHAGGQTGNAVAFFGAAMNNVNNGAVWGLNTITADCDVPGADTCTLTAELWNEFDFNVHSPNTSVFGLTLAGAGGANPKTAFGFTCESLDKFHLTGARWGNCLNSMDGTSQNALYVGSYKSADDATRANSGGQYVLYSYYDENANRQMITTHIDPGPPYASFVWASSHGEEIRFDLTMGMGLQPGLTGANIPSISQFWHFTDDSGNPQHYIISANNQGMMVFSGSFPNVNRNHFAFNGAIELAHIVPLGTPPGGGLVELEVDNGSSPGTCRLIARGGTSAAITVIADNIGSGC